MKRVSLRLVTLALAGPASTFAVSPVTSAGVTFALTAYVEKGGFKSIDPDTKEVTYEYEKITSKENADGGILSETTETKSVATPFRYGNAQILSELNAAGALDGTISGWSIVSISSATAATTGDNAVIGQALYAVKKNKTPARIEFTYRQPASVETASSKHVSDYLTEKTSYAATGSNKTSVTLGIGDFTVQGLVAGSYKFVSGSLGKGDAAASYATFLAGARKVSAFSGTYRENGVAEGSISVAAAKVVDLEKLTTNGGGSTSGSSSSGGVIVVDIDIGRPDTAVSPN